MSKLLYCVLPCALLGITACSTGASTPQAAPGASATSLGASSSDVAAQSSPRPPLDHVTFGATQGTSPSVYIGVARGYFAAEGLEVEVQNFQAAAELLPLLTTGKLDTGNVGISPAIYNAMARGVDLRIIADATRADPVPERNGTWLVTSKANWDSGEIRGPGDLRGRRVALSQIGTVHEILLERMLQNGGLTLEDVNRSVVPFADMLPALANGAIDASIATEPFVSLGANQGILHEVMAAGEAYPNMQITAIMASPDFVEQRGQVAERWMVGYLRGARDLMDATSTGRDRDQIIQIIAKAIDQDPNRLPARSALRALNADGAVNADSLIADYNWFVRHNQAQANVELQKAIDQRFVDAAIARLGRYQPR